MPKSTKSIKNIIKKYTSPTFLVMLLIAFALWYIKKLSYTYSSTVPITVVALGQQVKAQCLAEGSGYNLIAYKYLLSTKVGLGEEDLQPVPGSGGQRVYKINLFALQNAISVKLEDLKIISVEEPPEIVVPQEIVLE